MIQKDQIALFIKLGDHKNNWEWLQVELAHHKDLINTHFTWDDTWDFTEEDDLLALFCDCIVENKSIGIYDGAYKSVELATGKKFKR